MKSNLVACSLDDVLFLWKTHAVLVEFLVILSIFNGDLVEPLGLHGRNFEARHLFLEKVELNDFFWVARSVYRRASNFHIDAKGTMGIFPGKMFLRR